MNVSTAFILLEGIVDSLRASEPSRDDSARIEEAIVTISSYLEERLGEEQVPTEWERKYEIIQKAPYIPSWKIDACDDCVLYGTCVSCGTLRERGEEGCKEHTTKEDLTCA